MTSTQGLRELSKFMSGLVAADFLTGIWLLASGTLPRTIFGMWITPQFAWLWMGIDAFTLLVLVHYAWTPNLLKPHVTSRSLFFVIGTIFAAVAIAHFLRLAFGWQVMVAGWTAPMWISWIGVIVASAISYTSFHFAAQHGKMI